METIKKGPYRVVGIQVIAELDAVWIEMPKAWKALFRDYHEIQDRVRDIFIDITLSTNNGQYIGLAAAQVSAFHDIPRNMLPLEIPEQEYVHDRHVGPRDQIPDAVGRIYEWAKKNGIPVDDFRLDFGYTPEGTEEAHDLYVRVKR